MTWASPASSPAPAGGAAATYEQLLDAIGEEAMRSANRSLDELKKKTPRPRKPRR